METHHSHHSWIEHLPLLSKNKSGSENCSFLVQKNNIFFMDNHLLALWCWQHFLANKTSQNNFFHLDAHEDAKVDLDPSWWQKIQGISLKDYLNLSASEGHYKLFRWDNYLPVFVNQNQKLIRKSVFATHEVGIPGFCHQRISPHRLISDFSKLFVDELSWIINCDLDYFFANSYKESFLFDEKWIHEFFKQLKYHYDQNDIAMMTVALSPECCGSWANAEKILKIFDHYFQSGISDYLNITLQ